MHRVATSPILNVDPSSDQRKSSYRLAWVGGCSLISRSAIEKTFDANIIEIRQAIIDGHESDLEIALSPLVFRISDANGKFLKRRRVSQTIIKTYFLVFFIGLIIFTSGLFLTLMLYGKLWCHSKP